MTGGLFWADDDDDDEAMMIANPADTKEVSLSDGGGGQNWLLSLSVTAFKKLPVRVRPQKEPFFHSLLLLANLLLYFKCSSSHLEYFICFSFIFVIFLILFKRQNLFEFIIF